MSNTEIIKQKPFSGCGAVLTKDALLEYRQAKQQADASEARLEEFCSAIEDFGLGAADSRDTRAIRCREKAYTPKEILAQAEAEAIRLEKLTEKASNARGRVLTNILRQSSNLAEYRALRWLYVDSAEAKQRAVDVFPAVQGHVC
jgi:hypothetical protein